MIIIIIIIIIMLLLFLLLFYLPWIFLVCRVSEDEVVWGVLLVPLGLRVIVVNQVGKVTKGRRGNRDSPGNKDPKVIMEKMATQEEVEHLEPKETWYIKLLNSKVTRFSWQKLCTERAMYFIENNIDQWKHNWEYVGGNSVFPVCTVSKKSPCSVLFPDQCKYWKFFVVIVFSP